jgi:hypothetical protein
MEETVYSGKMKSFAKKAFDIAKCLIALPLVCSAPLIFTSPETDQIIIDIMDRFHLRDMLTLTLGAGIVVGASGVLTQLVSYPMSILKIDDPKDPRYNRLKPQ